jgi:hypothetical protein
MKLFSLRLTTLKSKLYAIFIAATVLRVAGFLVLPNTPSTLAPDEGNYGELTEWIAEGKPAEEYPYTNLYVASRSLILPAAFVNRIGSSGLDSVRMTASTYGLLTLLIAIFLILKLKDTKLQVSDYIMSNQKMIVLLLSIYAFLPSHLAWSIVGLREAALEFWVLLAFLSVFYLFEIKKSGSIFASVGMLISLVLVFSSRPQVGWVLSTTLLIYFFIRIKLRSAQILLLLTLVGTLLGHLATTPLPPAANRTFNLQVNLGKVALDKVDSIPIHHELNKLEAGSAIKTQDCRIPDGTRSDAYFCIVNRVPYTTYTFLVRPLLGADVTSSSSLFAAIENTFWLGAFLLLVLMLIRNRRLAFFGALAPSLLFFSIYSVAAGAYEGNMGTAFRHKSLILWVVLLLLASTIVATQQRKAEHQGISGSSKE